MDSCNAVLNIKQECEDTSTPEIKYSLVDSVATVAEEDALYNSSLNSPVHVNIYKVTKMQTESITELLNDIRKQRIIQNEYMLINSTLRDAFDTNCLKEKLPPSVYKKVSSIILSDDVKNCYGNCNPLDVTNDLLGLAPTETDLSDDEASQLGNIIEDLLDAKCTSVLSDNVRRHDLLIDLSANAENEETIELQRELENLSNKCHESLSRLHIILEEFCNLRQDVMPDLIEKESQLLKQKMSATEMKVRSESDKVTRRLYCDHSNTTKAIDMVADHVSKELTLCDKKLLHLQNKERSYEEMKENKVYQQILIEYNEIKDKIKYKKLAIDNLNLK